MSKVFVVNSSNHNYAKAEKYGALVNVTEGNIPIFKTDVIMSMLRESLKDFTENDFLLVSGPTLVNIMATLVVTEKLKEVKLLIFDAKEQDYTVRHLTA